MTAVASNKGLIDDPIAEPLVRAAGVEYFIQVVRPGFNSAWNSIWNAFR
jgi:hypothetical protein